MTNTFDASLPQEALDFITEEGVEWEVDEPSFTNDPDTGTTVEVPNKHYVKGTPRFNYDRKLIADNLVEAGDAQIFFAGLSLPFTPTGPDQGLKLRRSLTGTPFGDTFVVKEVRTHETGELVALYELRIGR